MPHNVNYFYLKSQKDLNAALDIIHAEYHDAKEYDQEELEYPNWFVSFVRQKVDGEDDELAGYSVTDYLNIMTVEKFKQFVLNKIDSQINK